MLEHIGVPLEISESLGTYNSIVVSREYPEIYFIPSDDNDILVHDYERKLWNIWSPGATILSYGIWYDNKLLVAYSTGGFARDTGSKTTQVTRLKTGWIRPGQIEGFARLKWIYLLGQYLTAHTVNVKLWYEDGTSELFTKVWSASSEPYILRMKPARQKAEAYQIEIYDASITGSGGGIWHGLGLIYLSKKKSPQSEAKTL